MVGVVSFGATRGFVVGGRDLNVGPKLSHVRGLLHGVNGPRRGLGVVRVTNAGNGNSITTVVTGTLRGGNFGAKLFASP